MNHELLLLAEAAALSDPRNTPLRLAFGLACVERVQHLLGEPGACDCLATLRAFVQGKTDRSSLVTAEKEIAAIANSHRGSNSIDGSAHAAVSATYTAVNTLAVRALEAAGYAAYAAVYA